MQTKLSVPGGPPRPAGRSVAGVGMGLCMLLAVALSVAGHEVLTTYIQHRVGVVVAARYLDVTVELTFFEDGSEHEREHMDADGDGRLSRAETDAWLRQLEPRLAEAIKLRVDGRPVALIPLRAPELDLLGDWRVGRGHHRLTLFFFASTPPTWRPGAEVVVEDRLWPKVRALVALQVEGRDGARLEAVPFADSLLPPARDGEPRMFKARVLTPPRAAPAAELSRKPRRRRDPLNPPNHDRSILPVPVDALAVVFAWPARAPRSERAVAPGILNFAGRVAHNHWHLFGEARRAELDALNRELRQADQQLREARDEAARQAAAARAAGAAERLRALVRQCPRLLRLDLTASPPKLAPAGPGRAAGRVRRVAVRDSRRRRGAELQRAVGRPVRAGR
jgi:hypothetical protein